MGNIRKCLRQPLEEHPQPETRELKNITNKKLQQVLSGTVKLPFLRSWQQEENVDRKKINKKRDESHNGNIRGLLSKDLPLSNTRGRRFPTLPLPQGTRQMSRKDTFVSFSIFLMEVSVSAMVTGEDFSSKCTKRLWLC